MRLSIADRHAIELAAREALPPGSRVLLFGSRTDDSRRGGDIDLLVELPAQLPPHEAVDRRTRFAARLYRLLGEQRIDVLMAAAGEPEASAVVLAARRQGIPLAQA